MPGTDKQNSMFKKTKGYTQGGNPFPVTSCGRRRNDGSPLRDTDNKRTKGKGRNFKTVKEGAGLTAAGRKSYNRKTGGNVKAPVTGTPKVGTTAYKRQKGFCSRSRSWTGERGRAARKTWGCSRFA
tara:strand:- start:45 stop:422 length:378 start_codon:yes stop_codon:yes gene_type:complete